MNLPDTWFQPEDHPVSHLFKRQGVNATLPVVGSDEWVKLYPSGPPDANIPAAWSAALAKATAAGLIPDIPIASQPGNYGGQNAGGPQICSGGAGCRAPGDIWDSPPGLIAMSFDDGPLPPSLQLYDFLKANNQTATHFFIGSNILNNPTIFLKAYTDAGDLAVHTWTHPQMTTLNNNQVLAELGWTMQIIHDSANGRIPRYWRPPYGDVDNRVRAIATHCFNLTTVVWNQDTDDWNIGTGATNPQIILSQFSGWLAGPKTPGLMVLEHELTDVAVSTFMQVYPMIKAAGWEPRSIPDLFKVGWYQNAQNNMDTPLLMNVAGSAPVPTLPPTISTNVTATPTPTLAVAAGRSNQPWSVCLLVALGIPLAYFS